MERSLGFVKINFQAEDFFNFLGISLDNYDARKLANIVEILHNHSLQMTIFSEIPVEKRFKSKSILVDIEFINIRKGAFTGEMIIVKEIYRYKISICITY